LSREPLYLRLKSDDCIKKLFNVFEDESFEEITDYDVAFRTDRKPDDPLIIEVNRDDTSLTLDKRLGVLFESDECLDIFLDDYYFMMEEYYGVPMPIRKFKEKVVHYEEGEYDELDGETKEEQKA
jgi:hypothetical protein